MEELRVELKLRNNRLLRLRESSGLSVTTFCDRVGISAGTFYALASLRMRPRKNGLWRAAAVKLAEFARVPEEDLFPDVLERFSGRASRRQEVLVADIDCPSTRPTPEQALERSEIRHLVREAVRQLPDSHRIVVQMRHGVGDHVEHDFCEIADQLEITRRRVVTIYCDALARFRRQPTTYRLLSAASTPPTEPYCYECSVTEDLVHIATCARCKHGVCTSCFRNHACP